MFWPRGLADISVRVIGAVLAIDLLPENSPIQSLSCLVNYLRDGSR